MVSYDEDDEMNPYTSDYFRMFEFKIRRCTRTRSHDWTDCPFAHPGEKARRRDPRKHRYSGKVCPDFRQGVCTWGDSCEFSHGVFESWLHPFRYRTEACKDGKNCKRKVCFFAHTPAQLRSPPDDSCMELTSDVNALSGLSPTSPLLGSSPVSSTKKKASVGGTPPARFTGSLMVLSELMNALDTIRFNESNLNGSFGAGDYMHGYDASGFPNPDLKWVEDLLK